MSIQRERQRIEIPALPEQRVVVAREQDVAVPELQQDPRQRAEERPARPAAAPRRTRSAAGVRGALSTSSPREDARRATPAIARGSARPRSALPERPALSTRTVTRRGTQRAEHDDEQRDEAERRGVRHRRLVDHVPVERRRAEDQHAWRRARPRAREPRRRCRCNGHSPAAPIANEDISAARTYGRPSPMTDGVRRRGPRLRQPGPSQSTAATAR